MGDLSTDIITELHRKFDRHKIWVWYDAQEKYQGIIDEVETALDDVTVARFDGSYLELKHCLYETDPDFEEKWLFYIPESRNDAQWFRDIHSLGRQYRVGADIGEAPVTQYLVEHDDNVPDAYETWGQNPDHQRLAFFCVLFETAGPNTDEWVRTYLETPDDYRDTIENYAMVDAWHAQLHDEYGVDAGLDARELATQLLFGAVAGRAPTARYDELAADDVRAAAEFCDDWQRYAPTVFTRYAQAIGANYDLAQAVIDSDNTSWEATAFKGIDYGLIRLVMTRLAEEPYADLPSLAAELHRTVTTRQESFWSEQQLVDWSVPAAAVDTLHRIKHVDSDTAKTLDPDALATRYTEEEGWWTVDAAYRQYIDATQSATYPYPREATVKARVTEQYMGFLKAVNRPLAEGLADTPTLGTPQTEFYEQFGSPDDGLAIIICDGLRYELAEAIRENLAKRTTFDQTLTAVSAALPSITEVGMAAHLPGELGLDIDDGQFVVTSGDTELSQKSDRDARLEAAGFEVADLDDVGDTPLEELQDTQPVPRVVYSGTIDKLGEGLDDDAAFSQVAAHVDDVERAIQRLKQAGYTDFIITSDHGFLYTDELTDDLKVEAPDVAAVVKRRFAAAEADAPRVPSEEYIEFDSDALADLGISAPDVTLMFPRSVACFKARGGNMRYFHGGISLQELLVPCLTVTTSDTGSEAAITYDVSLPDTVTNATVAVDIDAKSERDSFTQTPTLELRATIDETEVADPVEVSISPGTNTARLRLKQGAISGGSAVHFTVIDTETRETLTQQTATLDLLNDDDGGFDV